MSSKISPQSSLHKYNTSCKEFVKLLREYKHFIDSHTHIRYITLDVFNTHSNYIARLDGILNEIYVLITEGSRENSKMMIHYNIYMHKKTMLEKKFCHKLIHEKVVDTLLKKNRSFKELRATN